jgi:hypothetical protein
MSDQALLALKHVYLTLAGTMELATGKPCQNMADWLMLELLDECGDEFTPETRETLRSLASPTERAGFVCAPHDQLSRI